MDISNNAHSLIAIEECMKKAEQQAKYHADQVLFHMSVRDNLALMQNNLLSRMTKVPERKEKICKLTFLSNLLKTYQF